MPFPISALEVAEYLLYLDYKTSEKDSSKREGWEPITNLKLQKLLYYCQANSLLSTTTPLFLDKIIAWKYGPVVEEVYNTYSDYKADILYQKIAIKIPPKIDEVHSKSIKHIYDTFNDENGKTLVNRTHNETPWIHAFYTLGVYSEIKPKSIYEYFRNKTDHL